VQWLQCAVTDNFIIKYFFSIGLFSQRTRKEIFTSFFEVIFDLKFIDYKIKAIFEFASVPGRRYLQLLCVYYIRNSSQYSFVTDVAYTWQRCMVIGHPESLVSSRPSVRLGVYCP
jgi:hypothetical protein